MARNSNASKEPTPRPLLAETSEPDTSATAVADPTVDAKADETTPAESAAGDAFLAPAADVLSQDEARQAPANVIDQATDLLQTRQALYRQEEDEQRTLDLDQYVLLLSRSDNPEPNDALELSHVLESCEITPEAMRADIADLQAIRRFLKLRLTIDQLKQTVTQLAEEFEQLKKRHIKEHDEARKALGVARYELGYASDADYQITRIATRRPILFRDLSVEPPVPRHFDLLKPKDTDAAV